MKKNEKKMKPCPFCGGKAEMYKIGMWYYVQCKKCDVMTTQDLNKDDLIKAWNTRIVCKKND